jgi:hypothetical protein
MDNIKNKITLIFIHFIVLCACGKHKPNDVLIPQYLLDKSRQYCDMAYDKLYLKAGYVHSKCDGSGFTSLYAVGCPHLDINLKVFEDDSGKLHRDPKRSCFKNGESKSESSKDMVLMRMFAAWRTKDLAWVERFLSFAKSNDWHICAAIDTETLVSRCVLTPDLINLLYDLKKVLSGGSVKGVPILSDFIAQTGFRGHIQALKINLAGEIYGGISKIQLDILKKLSKRQPKNALYKALVAKWDDGDFVKAFDLLSVFPESRLPNNRDDWCTTYLFQHDHNHDDWTPCPSQKFAEHPGHDHNLVLSIIK